MFFKFLEKRAANSDEEKFTDQIYLTSQNTELFTPYIDLPTACIKAETEIKNAGYFAEDTQFNSFQFREENLYFCINRIRYILRTQFWQEIVDIFLVFDEEEKLIGLERIGCTVDNTANINKQVEAIKIETYLSENFDGDLETIDSLIEKILRITKKNILKTVAVTEGRYVFEANFEKEKNTINDMVQAINVLQQTSF